MTTSRQRQFLSPILEWKPIPRDTLAYFEESLRRRLHSVILDAFKRRAKERGLTQKELAKRIHKSAVTVNRWLSTASNLTLDSISDLMVGLGMDFDDFPFTPIEKTILSADEERRKAEEDAQIEKLSAKILTDLQPQLSKIVAALSKEQERSAGAATSRPSSPHPGTTLTTSKTIQQQTNAGSGKVLDFVKALQRRPEEQTGDKVRKPLKNLGEAA